jgi:hypothetical protein
MKNDSVRGENGKEFVSAVEECGELLRSGRYTWFERRAL